MSETTENEVQNENTTTQRETYLMVYAKKQEDLLHESSRRLLDSETRRSVLEMTNTDLTNKLDAYEKAIVSRIEEYDRALNEKSVLLTQALEGLQAVTLDRDSLKEEVEAKDKDLARLTEHNTILAQQHGDVAASLSELASLREQINNKNQEIEARNKIHVADSEDKNKLAGELNAVNNKITSLENELNGVRNNYKVAVEENANLKSRVNQLNNIENEVNVLRNNNKIIAEENTSLKIKLNELSKKENDLTVMIDNMKKKTRKKAIAPTKIEDLTEWVAGADQS